MKKLIALAVMFLFAANAGAMSLTNPLFMPEKGNFVSNTEAYMADTTSGDSNKIYNITERLSYNFTNRLQFGAYIGYSDIDVLDESDFTNPGIFGYFRILDEFLKFDVGAEYRMNAFDKVDEAANKYGVIGRLGADLDIVSVGGSLKAEYVEPENTSSRKDATVNAFAIFDVLDILGLGAEGEYYVNGWGENNTTSYELLARVDINPIPSKFGIVVFGGYDNYDMSAAEGYKLGARLVFSF